MIPQPLLDKHEPVNTPLQPKQLLNSLLQSARKLLTFDIGGLALWDEERQVLVPFIENLPDSPQKQIKALHEVKPGEGIVGRVAMTHHAVYVPDVQRDPQYIHVYQGMRSEIAVPILLKGQLLGVLNIESAIVDAFKDSHIAILQALAEQAALVIDTMRLYDHLREHYERTEGLLKLAEIVGESLNLDEMMRRVVELTRNLLDVGAAAVLLYDRNESMLMPLWGGFGFPDSFYRTHFPVNTPRSLLAIAFNVAHPQYVNNIIALAGIERDLAVQAGFSNLMVVPLRAQDNALGVYMVANRAAGFTSEEAQFLTAMGSHIATALRNLDYVEQLRLFKGLFQVAQRVSAELATEQVLIAACQSIVEAIEGIDHAAIVVNDRAPLSGHVVAEYPLRGAIGQRFGLKDYRLYEEMVETLAPAVVNDVASATDLLGINQAMLLNLGIKSLMVVPLVVHNEFIGSIGIDATLQSHQFSAAEMDVMIAIAAQLAISIRNAQLFEQVTSRTQELIEANRLKNEFLAKMSHELRTPMNSILGFSDALLSGIYGQTNDKQRARLELIQKNGRNLLSLIDDLLDLSKIEAGRMELAFQTVNLKDEIQACLQAADSQMQAKKLKLRFVAPDAIPPVVADSLRLRQVINNLLSNAIKFTREGGITIRIQVKTRESKSGKPAQEIWTSITDTGIGIKPEHFDIIFDEFRQADGSTTREFGGSGLGLAISRRLLELMHGRIWLESELGNGSTFTFALPVGQIPEPASTA